MPTPLDKDNHSYNKRQAAAAEKIAKELHEININLELLRELAEAVVSRLPGSLSHD
jgi:hypothetical protein